MGNCIGHQKAAMWVVDDDESGAAESRPMNYSRKEKAREVAGEEEEKKGLLEGIAAEPVATTELKVKISKKQLEELLKKFEEGKGVPIQQVLTDLLNKGEVAAREHEQHWRPSLQSIPEFPE